eukprot:PhM_4_TR3328/c0_g1_i1/m.27646/K21918/KCTD8_12_16; BTB/POZ domain-containing protein KCTD8/12/16
MPTKRIRDGECVEERTAPLLHNPTTTTTSSTPIDGFVELNVGGVVYVTSYRTLRRDAGSLLSDMFSSEWAREGLARDADGRYFIDRDGSTFRYILNYLRGCPVCVRPEDYAMVAADAMHYGLEGLKKLLGINTRVPWTFPAGPGVTTDRTHFHTHFVVCMCGDFFSSGSVSQQFRVEKSDYVGIGVVSRSCTDQSTEYHKVANCGVYYMSGVVYHNYPEHVKVDSAEPYQDGDIITVAVNMDAKRLTWKRNGAVVQLVSIPSATELRVAVVLKKNSAVVAISNDGAVAMARDR